MLGRVDGRKFGFGSPATQHHHRGSGPSPEQTPGPGCRAYLRHGGTVIVLRAGGNKRTRARDIEVTLKPCALPAAASRDQNQNDPWKTQNHVETAEARLHRGLLDEGATWTCRARSPPIAMSATPTMSIPNHVPRIDGRDPAGVAFTNATGYIQALLEALVLRPAGTQNAYT